MIQIIPSNGARADDLAEIINPVRDAVVAARPDPEVDRDTIAPENRVRIYVGRARIADNILGVVHRSGYCGEKSERYG